MLLTAALSRADRTAEEDEGVALMQEISDNLDVLDEEQEEMAAEPEMEEQPAAPEGAGLMARGQ
jgi:hypothetical protein